MKQTTQQQHQENQQLLWLLKHYPTQQLHDDQIYEEYYELYTDLGISLRDQGVPVYDGADSEGADEEVQSAAESVYNVPFDRALYDRLDQMAQRDPAEFLRWYRANGG